MHTLYLGSMPWLQENPQIKASAWCRPPYIPQQERIQRKSENTSKYGCIWSISMDNIESLSPSSKGNVSQGNGTSRITEGGVWLVWNTRHCDDQTWSSKSGVFFLTLFGYGKRWCNINNLLKIPDALDFSSLTLLCCFCTMMASMWLKQGGIGVFSFGDLELYSNHYFTALILLP